MALFKIYINYKKKLIFNNKLIIFTKILSKKLSFSRVIKKKQNLIISTNTGYIALRKSRWDILYSR